MKLACSLQLVACSSVDGISVILAEGTGIAIVSIGETRVLQFRNIATPEKIIDYALPAGSLIYMSQEVQAHWQHAIPRAETALGRISLTFRKMK